MDMRAGHAFGSAPGNVVLVQKKQRFVVPKEGKIYAVLVVVECVSLLSLCVISLLYARNSDDSDADSVEYTSVVAMVASVALLYFTLDSILMENIFQFAASQFLHILIVAYCIWHYLGPGLGKLYDEISLYVMIGVCTFELAYLILVYPVTQAFGYRLYKKLGANAKLPALYRTASIFFTLLKLDFALGLMMLLLAVFYLMSDVGQIVLNSFALLVTLGWLVLGFQFVQRESTRLAPLFFLFAPLEPAFLLYKLIMMKQSSDSDEDKYPVFSWNEFLLTGCVAVTVRLLCILFGVLCWRSFGQGLRERMFDTHEAGLPHSARVLAMDHGQDPSDGPTLVNIGHAQDELYPEGGSMHGAPSRGATVVVQQQQQTRAKESTIRTYLQPLLA